jgi:hypothetical protein
MKPKNLIWDLAADYGIIAIQATVGRKTVFADWEP